MKNCILLFLLITTTSLFGQNNDTWTAFWNSDTTLVGYKDKNGVVKIEPKFIPLTLARKFENIIAVMDEYASYYLTKAGKIVGRDSLYVFDNTPDCESEGFICFRDRKTDKAGMFNKDGNIVIPAEYNDLTRVSNGMVIALKGAKKEYLDKYQEHWRWIGGQEMLIDTLNNILIDSFPYTIDLNFFSIEKTKTPHLDTIRDYFLAKDGNYLSFINFEKEFKRWLFDSLLTNLTKEKLINASYNTITCWSNEGWTKTNSEDFVNNNFETLNEELLRILNSDCSIGNSILGLNPYIYKEAEFEKYFNNCGDSKNSIYPLMEIVVYYSKENKYFTRYQDNYDFLRTDNGYKLISATIRNNEIK